MAKLTFQKPNSPVFIVTLSFINNSKMLHQQFYNVHCVWFTKRFRSWQLCCCVLCKITVLWTCIQQRYYHPHISLNKFIITSDIHMWTELCSWTSKCNILQFPLKECSLITINFQGSGGWYYGLPGSFSVIEGHKIAHTVSS